MKKINVTQDSEQWHDFRKQGLGSSDIAAIMGVSPWSSAYKVFEDKLGLSTNFMNSAMSRGKQFEPVAREAFEKFIGRKYEACCCMHPDIDYAIASLDGYNEETNTLLEIKVPLEKNFKGGEIPIHYQYQIQWQMFVSGATMAYFFIYSPEINKFHMSEILPDFDLMHSMSDCAQYFWLNLQNGVPPKLVDKDLPDFSSEIPSTLIEELKLYKRLKDDAEESYDIAKKKIMELGDDGSFMCHGIKFIRNAPRCTYDIEGMRESGIPVDNFKKISKDIGGYRVMIPKELK